MLEDGMRQARGDDQFAALRLEAAADRCTGIHRARCRIHIVRIFLHGPPACREIRFAQGRLEDPGQVLR